MDAPKRCERALESFDGFPIGNPCDVKSARWDNRPGCGHSNVLHRSEATGGGCIGCDLEALNSRSARQTQTT
jgi:hypothetical protein